MIKKLISSILASIVMMGIAKADIIHVPSERSTIQLAVNMATPGDTIILAPGTYGEFVSTELNQTLTIASQDLLDPGNHYLETIIAGVNNSAAVVTVNCGIINLFGLTIQDGHNVLDGYGGGVKMREGCGQLTITNCILKNNDSQQDGGAVYLTGSGANLVMKNCIVQENWSVQGGGVFVGDGATVDISNTVFYGNSAASTSGGSVVRGQNAIITNCIIWDNWTPLFSNNAGLSVTYSNIQGGIFPGAGNISSNPSFIYPSASNFSLASYSPCIGGGNQLNAAPFDIQGNHRPQPVDSEPDMGAFEHALGSPGPRLSTTFYVATHGSDTTGSGSEINPFASLSHTIDFAWSNDTIIVDPGLYTENLDIQDKNLIVASRYFLTGDTSYISSTILDGGMLGSVIRIYGTVIDTSTIICGLTLQNGFTARGGGIDCRFADPIFDELRIISNTCGTGGGAGLYLEEASPIIRNTIIANNVSADVGGGVYAREHSNAKMINTVIRDNQAATFGGGFHLKDQSNINFWRCLIIGNSGNRGGGFSIRLSTPKLIHCVIADNTAAELGGGIYTYMTARPVVVNSIVWGNEPSQVEITTDLSSSDSHVTIAYTNILMDSTNVVTNNNGTINISEGNIDTPPSFWDPPMNYSLNDDSPAINAGTSFFQYGLQTLFDLDSTEYVGSNPDMGSFEYAIPPISPLQNFNLTSPPDSALLDTAFVTFKWENASINSVELVNYSLHIIGPTRDTAVTDLVDTFHVFLGEEFFEAGGAYQWQVHAVVGSDTLNSIQSNHLSFILTLSNHSNDIISKFRLYNAYPNPFNPSTTINYELPQLAKVTLIIYDVRGRIIQTLVNETQPGGYYETRWNGTDDTGVKVSGGMYFARLQTKEYASVLKMVYLK
ncbi:MAG: T9SS type A sorting domain-containing protein [Candidatus Marinimicrobia bacterium]|nr:T9SS type A sorting domain-containing protein [Candidatus Neomarinimicrobiota bacterium]